MTRVRKLAVVAVLAGGLLWGGEAQATITPTPDDAKCTFTNDFIAVCTLKDGSTMCKDNNGKDIDCPTAKLRPIAGLAVAR